MQNTVEVQPPEARPVLNILMADNIQIIQKAPFQRRKWIIEKKQFFPSYQFGFQNKHSTVDQMHRIIVIKIIQQKWGFPN